MLKHKEFFDLSNFPKNSKIFCNDNKKIPEKMKDEYRGTQYMNMQEQNQKCVQYLI